MQLLQFRHQFAGVRIEVMRAFFPRNIINNTKKIVSAEYLISQSQLDSKIPQAVILC